MSWFNSTGGGGNNVERCVHRKFSAKYSQSRRNHTFVCVRVPPWPVLRSVEMSNAICFWRCSSREARASLKNDKRRHTTQLRMENQPCVCVLRIKSFVTRRHAALWSKQDEVTKKTLSFDIYSPSSSTCLAKNKFAACTLFSFRMPLYKELQSSSEC